MTAKRMPRNLDKAIAYVLARPTTDARISGLQLLALRQFPSSPNQKKVREVLDREQTGR